VVAKTLAFSKSLYSAEAVRSAMDAYRDLAAFDLAPGVAALDLTVSLPDGEPTDELLDEFANHVLYETVRLFRSGDGG
jgi:hypothetical protein